MKNYGFKIIGKVVSGESLKSSEIELAKKLGKEMIK